MAEAPEKKPGESKFFQFITAKKLDPRRIMAASHQLESLDPGRPLHQAEEAPGSEVGRHHRTEGDAKAPARAGRSRRAPLDAAATSGGKMSGPTKTRLLPRAVNHLLEQKKQEKVELRTLF